jgi:DNA-binding SARP family transcriptional activator
MQLLDWKRIDKGAIRGRATVLLPIGLQIADIGVFTKDAQSWAQMPSEAMRDADGQLLKDDRGKTRYRSPLRWATRELQERFSAALIALIEAEHGPLAL